MSTVLLILIVLFVLAVMWLRRLWQRDPMRILRFIFRVPSPSGTSRKKEKGQNSGRSRRKPRTATPASEEPIIPKEYAVDVEFTEVKEYSSETIGAEGKTTEKFRESQVSDVEWEEIK